MKKSFNKTMIEIGIFLLIFIVIIVIVFFILNKTGTSLFIEKNGNGEELVSDELEIKKEITNYLANAEKPNDIEGHCFASLENYGFDETEENTLYVQYYVQCYKLGDKVIQTLNGYTIPAKVVMEKSNDGYSVKEVVKPSESNVNTMFPVEIATKLSRAKEDGTIKTLKDSVDKQAKDYYGDLTIN